MPTVATPVVLGINWYEDFDKPVKVPNKAVGHLRPTESYWIGRNPNSLGRILGGHCLCSRPPSVADSWWPFYDQGEKGACTGFGWSRFASLMNRRRYDGFALYYAAQLVDEFDDTPPEDGSSVRAAGDVMRDKGPWRSIKGHAEPNPSAEDGITQNRWATSIEEIAACLSPEDGGKHVLDDGFIRLLNSWGPYYPSEVRMPLETLNRLIFSEGGDATVATDRPAHANTAP
jgi:hypothetical protein